METAQQLHDFYHRWGIQHRVVGRSEMLLMGLRQPVVGDLLQLLVPAADQGAQVQDVSAKPRSLQSPLIISVVGRIPQQRFLLPVCFEDGRVLSASDSEQDSEATALI
jgi:hypothetical protein